MLNKIHKTIVFLLFSGAVLLSDDSESLIRLYVTSDVKGETEPCG